MRSRRLLYYIPIFQEKITLSYILHRTRYTLHNSVADPLEVPGPEGGASENK